MTPRRSLYLLSVVPLLLVLVGCTAVGQTPTDPDTAAPAPTAAQIATATSGTPAEPSLTRPPVEPTTPPPPAAALATTEPATTGSPTAAAWPTATPVLMTPVPLPGTLILYAALTAIEPAEGAYWAPYYGLKTSPALPFVDPAVFDRLYGVGDMGFDFSMFLDDFAPQISPDGRYVLVPGLAAAPGYGVAGTGTWLLDLTAQTARELLPNGIVASWSPTSDAITYGLGGTLYTLSITQGAEPQPRLQDDNLWTGFVKWSPTGDAIAALIGIEPDFSDPANPKYATVLTLVSTGGGPPRQLAVLDMPGAEYSPSQLSWSPDGQYVLAMNKVYDLNGNLVSPEYGGAVNWLPEGNHLLLRGSNGVDIITIAGERLIRIDDDYSDTWAFSHDGRRLAFVRGPLLNGPLAVAVFDLESGESWTVRAGGAWPIRWSADDSRLILGVYDAQDGRRPQIITVGVAPGGGEQLLADYAQLIDAIPFE